MEGVSSGWDTEKEIDAVTAARICAAGAARALAVSHTPWPCVFQSACRVWTMLHVQWCAHHVGKGNATKKDD